MYIIIVYIATYMVFGLKVLESSEHFWKKNGKDINVMKEEKYLLHTENNVRRLTVQ